MSVRNISAVTFAVSDMSRSVRFYRSLGLEMLYGGEEASCTSFQAGESFVNLIGTKGYEGRWWGRPSFGSTTSTRSIEFWSMRETSSSRCPPAAS